MRESARLSEALQTWRKCVDDAKDPAERRKLAQERPPRALSAVSINKTITRLGQILEVALEYELIDRNPARGKRRGLKTTKPTPVWLDSAEHIEALLDAAGALDRVASVKGGVRQKGGLIYRRAMLATFVFAGPRISELTALRWRDVDLAGSRITIRKSKTDAGMRAGTRGPRLHAARVPARDAPRPGRQGAPARARRRRRLAHDRQQRCSDAVERACRDRQAEPRFRPVARRSCPSCLPQPQPPGCELRDYRPAMADSPEPLAQLDLHFLAATMVPCQLDALPVGGAQTVVWIFSGE
ncbi:MAG TPA: hypothetical protein VIJ66_04405 [Solirubrobacteraceae bacterium]